MKKPILSFRWHLPLLNSISVIIVAIFAEVSIQFCFDVDFMTEFLQQERFKRAVASKLPDNLHFICSRLS